MKAKTSEEKYKSIADKDNEEIDKLNNQIRQKNHIIIYCIPDLEAKR